VITPQGVLGGGTYPVLRDAIITTALHEDPSAVIIDVTGLEVADASVWTAISSARWHLREWPNVPVVVVSADAESRRTLADWARYVPVYPSLQTAIWAHREPGACRYLHRRHAALPALNGSVVKARDLVTQWLTQWSHKTVIPMAKLVTTVFVENVLRHTDSPPTVLVESTPSAVTIAVHDASPIPATRREEAGRGTQPFSGLGLVAAFSTGWGSIPTSLGKTVWASIDGRPPGSPHRAA
jgi:hypothetical protein